MMRPGDQATTTRPAAEKMRPITQTAPTCRNSGQSTGHVGLHDGARMPIKTSLERRTFLCGHYPGCSRPSGKHRGGNTRPPASGHATPLRGGRLLKKRRKRTHGQPR